MDQKALYEVVRKCGAKVILFSDHPDFFSSWSIRVLKNGKNYLIENDGRDGWMFFYIELGEGRLQEKERLISQSLSESEILCQCEAWLSGLS